MLNKQILINKKYKNNKVLLFVLVSTLILLIIYTYKVKTYDVVNTYGYIECDDECYINTTINLNKIDILNNEPIFEINNQKFKPEYIEYNDIVIDNQIPYQVIKIKTELDPNKGIKIKILNNKQRIIRKIFNSIKEG